MSPILHDVIRLLRAGERVGTLSITSEEPPEGIYCGSITLEVDNPQDWPVLMALTGTPLYGHAAVRVPTFGPGFYDEQA